MQRLGHGLLLLAVTVGLVACGDPDAPFTDAAPAATPPVTDTQAPFFDQSTAPPPMTATPALDAATRQRLAAPDALANVGPAEFDRLAERLIAANPYEQAPGYQTMNTGPNCAAADKSGAGFYAYRQYIVNNVGGGASGGTNPLTTTGGQLFTVDTYAANPKLRRVGQLQLNGNPLLDVRSMINAEGVWYATNDDLNSSATATRNRLFSFNPDAAVNGVIAVTEVALTLASGSTANRIDGLAVRLEQREVSQVRISWQASGGRLGQSFQILRSTNPNSGFTAVGATIPWGAQNIYCVVDTNAPACTRVYYRVRTLWDGCSEDSQVIMVDTPC